MIERGAFAGVDASMMVHPAGAELRSMQTLAIHQVLAEYRGKAAHAAAAPWLSLIHISAPTRPY